MGDGIVVGIAVTEATETELMATDLPETLLQIVADYPLPDGVPDADMNIDEIAAALATTVNTVSKWIKDPAEPRFPVVQAGGQGRAYVLRLSHCYAWKKHRDDAETTRVQKNRDAIERVQASFLGVDLDSPEAALSPKDRRALAEADLVHSKAAMVRRQLVKLDDMTELLEGIFKVVRDGLESMPDRLERELDLKPQEVVLVQRIATDILNTMGSKIEEAELAERDISDAEVPSQLLI